MLTVTRLVKFCFDTSQGAEAMMQASQKQDIHGSRPKDVDVHCSLRPQSPTRDSPSTTLSNVFLCSTVAYSSSRNRKEDTGSSGVIWYQLNDEDASMKTKSTALNGLLHPYAPGAPFFSSSSEPPDAQHHVSKANCGFTSFHRLFRVMRFRLVSMTRTSLAQAIQLLQVIHPSDLNLRRPCQASTYAALIRHVLHNSIILTQLTALHPGSGSSDSESGRRSQFRAVDVSNAQFLYDILHTLRSDTGLCTLQGPRTSTSISAPEKRVPPNEKSNENTPGTVPKPECSSSSLSMHKNKKGSEARL
ncbi:hypothetical protein EVG20_g8266 [Dentipellis fragilis]|uniref:Uncharacterized protein n=1 Tax=Dentipellis fragilis TaxID=205917 RepID=A0A4Y9Y6J0_9AGAM|nr:hypothetical protein EVG20_g8266 [Dentipellis fragilis]